jgi:TonB-dependent receptor
MKSPLFLTLIISLLSFCSLSQQISIQGTIRDSVNRETASGVRVQLEGTTQQAKTDPDGNFSFMDVAPGTYTIILTHSAYKGKKINVTVTDPAQTVQANVELDPLVKALGTVTATAKKKVTGDAALAKEQQNSASVTNGMSAESIKKTPDARISDVLKRISGASIQDNKFVIIRGLNDRYNAAYINGAPLPSSESDRKAFSFDIFPSIMLDNLVIVKTATPDMPGEFAGGVININTKNIQEKNFQNLSLGTSFNTQTTFRDFSTYKGGKFDWLGVDDGARAISDKIPTTAEYNKLNATSKAEYAKEMTPSWAIDQRKALPTVNLQYSLGRNVKFNEKREFGFVAAYTYQNNLSTNRNIRREFEEQALGVIQKTELIDTVYTQTVLNSALLNFAYKHNENNRFGFKNMYSINSEDRVNIRSGVREMDSNPHQYEKSSNRMFTQNLLYTGQLEGSHLLPKSKIKINWTAGYSDVNRNVPNMRRVVYQKSALFEADTSEQYYAIIQNNGTIPTAAGNMFWSEIKEKIYSARYEAELPVDFGLVKGSFKIGGMQQYRNRDFSARSMGFSKFKATGIAFDNNLLALPEDQIFSPEHLGRQADGSGGFKLEEATKVSDSYEAASILNAGFGMADLRIGEKLRIVGGARLESYNQKFDYTEAGSNIDKHIDTTVNDLLPSVNLIYSLTKKMNIRLSYYKTVSRPEFRELAPFAFYNFAQDNILSGNTQLKRALINNMDVRYEIYPGAGQLFSISGFYKDFTDAIELINRTGVAGASELYYTNIDKVSNYGVELEYRVKLSIFDRRETKNSLLDNTTLFTNLSLIKSKVNMKEIIGASADSRPMQGQSPYIVNAGLQFAHPTKEWTVSASYNVIGRRIYIVGNIQEPDVWENSRNVIDLQFTKTFRKKFEFKVNIKDLLAQDLIFYQDINKNKKYDLATDNRWQETNFGQTISLSLNYNF